MNKVNISVPEVSTGFGQYDLENGVTYNYYDPEAKKFVLHYFYNKSAPRIIWEELTYVGTRP